mgnify:CR=1 FL=1
MGSKLRKLNQAIKAEKYNKGVSKQVGFRIENPNYDYELMHYVPKSLKYKIIE